MNQRISIWLPLITGLALALGVLTGYIIQGRYNSSSPQLIQLGKGSKFDEVLNYVRQKYVSEVDASDISDQAIEEVLQELDPHSIYIPVEDMKALEEDMTGNFEGIGIEFYIVEDTIMVVTPLSGGPSEALGISSGDRIVTIDDSLVAGIGITNAQVVRRLKGPKGTEVKVGIRRTGIPELIDYTIRRDRIPIVSVDVGFMVDDSTGYIKINRFSATTYREFMAELDELTRQGATRLLLDLRQNPGGYLEEAVNILDEFIDGRKELVYTMGRKHPKFTYKARKPGLFEEGELIVLIDEGSASASEIVAGSLQDWDRAQIIGRRSFGKGLVQEQYALSDGSALRLTVAKYYTPSGRCIQKPYVNGGDESYDRDLLQRYDHGELFSADSIVLNDSLVYRTKVLNRKVYGGGGVMPDLFVAYDTTGLGDFYQAIARRGLIRQFAYDYFSTHTGDWSAYETPKSYASGYEVPATVIDAFLNDLRENGQVQVPGRIDPKVMDNIKEALKATFAKQIWNGDGYYPVVLSDDPVFLQAMSEFGHPLSPATSTVE